MGKIIGTIAALVTIISGLLIITDHCSDQSSSDSYSNDYYSNSDNSSESADDMINDSNQGNETSNQNGDNTNDDPKFESISFDLRTSNNRLTWPFSLSARNVRGKNFSFTVQMLIFDEFPKERQTPLHCIENSYDSNNSEIDNPNWRIEPQGVELERLQLASGRDYYFVLHVIYNGYIVLRSQPKSYTFSAGY